MIRLLKFGVLAASLALTACVSPDYQYTATGAALGGATGAIVGHQINHKNGKYVGGAVGALVGGAIGNNADAIYNRGRYPQPGYHGNPYPTQSTRYDSRYPDTTGYNKYPSNSY